MNNFDFIIDDGPHTLKSQIKAILYYFPKLKKNGYLIIEDILKGYISCFFLSIRAPINCKIKVHNIRKHKPGRDNMLFVIQKKSFKYQMIPIRLLLIIRLFFNIPKELFYKAKI